MARVVREKSNNGIYHIMIRAIKGKLVIKEVSKTENANEFLNLNIVERDIFTKN